jgi:hypothetical protein
MSAVAAPGAVPKAEPRAANPGQTVTLLGPQGRRPLVADVLAEQGIDGAIAVVTAGWQEREAEVQALDEHLHGRAENLRLHGRADDAFARDRELEAVHRRRQARLRELQRLYDVRVEHAMAAVADVARRRARSDLAQEEWASAIAAVQRIDGEHLTKIAAVHAEFDAELRLDSREELARHREEIRGVLAGCAALAVAGGHVAVLLNRLRLFGVAGMAAKMPVVAWSGGAMVLAERVILYHDSPPQGPGNPEVLEAGLGLVRGVVPLPHAAERLRLDDADRVARFARRFVPARCVVMDDGARLTVGPDGWSASPETRVLGADGRVTPWERP